MKDPLTLKPTKGTLLFYIVTSYITTHTSWGVGVVRSNTEGNNRIDHKIALSIVEMKYGQKTGFFHITSHPPPPPCPLTRYFCTPLLYIYSNSAGLSFMNTKLLPGGGGLQLERPGICSLVTSFSFIREYLP